jgi:hypothetical protein
MTNTFVPQGAPLATASIVKDFAFAGKATITLRNAKSGNRFTYKFKAPKKQNAARPVFFVSVMTGKDNESDYSFIGTVFGKATYQHSAKSALAPSVPSVSVLNSFLGFLERNQIPNGLEVWHEGCCGRCGRKLTVPASILSGIGPECEKKRWKEANDQLSLTLDK